MELQPQPSSTTAVDTVFEDLCQLIDAIDQTTGLLEQHCLFRRISRTAETLGLLRQECAPSAN
jgi:hypothetical protein